MVTAMAALASGQISINQTYTCTGTYKIGDYTYKCLGTHGTVDLETAIEKSCNLYFYNLAYDMNIDTLAEYAAAFGLGSTTGLELSEAEGTIASREYQEMMYEKTGDPEYLKWYTGYTLQAAIGQSYNQFTPLQMANYIATIANNGTRYSTTLLKEIQNSTTYETVYSQEPEILGTLDVDSKYFTTIRNGMIRVAQSGTARTVLSGLDVQVAAKTGAAQTGGKVDDGVFVCYAPVENPEIAIAVVIENGGSGSSVGRVARDVLDYYYGTHSEGDEANTEDSLLP